MTSETERDGIVSREELRSYIRFSLAQLRIRNEHHRFEKLCEALARQKITPNIVVGTGPVSAGGDQARDFETFHAYTQNHIRALGQKLGIAPDDAVVFCCTVEQGNVASKVHSDLETSTSVGTDVDFVVYFTETDLPTSRRHAMIEHAAKNYSVSLEILDGQTLTGLLCDRDTFWIAVEFLDIPSYVVPEEAGPAWYSASRTRWLERSAPAMTSGDLIELTGCLRFAVFNSLFNGDIEMWLRFLAPLMEQDSDEVIRRRARFETAAASIRGLGNLRPADNLITQALDEAVRSEAIDELDDALILCMYAQAAWMHGVTDLSAAALDSYSERLEQRIIALLESATPNGDRCRLLWLLGRSRIRWQLADMERREERKHRLPVELFDNGKGASNVTHIPIDDPDSVLAPWLEVVDLLAEAPDFPVRAFAESITIYTAALDDRPLWSELTSRLDDRLSTLAGVEAVADICCSRGRQLEAGGKPIAALYEFHRARVRLIAGDTRNDATHLLLEAARIYFELGVFYASKHYALAAGALASDRDDRSAVIADSLIAAATCDFLAGNWMSMMSLLPHALGSHASLRVAPGDLDLWDDFPNLIWATAVVVRAAELSSNVELQQYVCAVTEEAGLTRDALRESGVFDTLPSDEFGGLLDYVHENSGQAAFGDAGKARVIQFALGGARWRIRASNTYWSVCAAERLAAILQVLLVALSQMDLVLVDATVELDVSTKRSSKIGSAVKKAPEFRGRSNDGALRWKVTLTRDAGPHSIEFEESNREALLIAIVVVTSMSLLPEEELDKILTPSRDIEHLFLAMFPHIRYDRAYSVVSRSEFMELKRQRFRPLAAAGFGSSRIAPVLDVPSEFGPTFNGESPVERVGGRYAVIQKMLPITLPRLVASDNFRQTVRGLRDGGWKDWHILLAVYNAVVSARYAEKASDVSLDEHISELAENPVETADDSPIDPEEFTEEVLRRYLYSSAGATAAAFGLKPRLPFTDEELLRTLDSRYGYWIIDVEHADPFCLLP